MRSLRDIMRLLPADGEIRQKLRSFNMMPSKDNKAASVKELAESLGVDVRLVPLQKGFAGRLVQDPFADSGYCIEVNQYHNVRSQRFTVLHELGHLFLHVDKSDPFAAPMHLNRGDEEFYFDQTAEQEANDFADTLLFGDGALAAAYSIYNGKIDCVAHYFGVTEKMVEVALRKFGVI